MIFSRPSNITDGALTQAGWYRICQVNVCRILHAVLHGIASIDTVIIKKQMITVTAV